MKVSKSIIVGVFLIGGLVLFGVGLFMIGSETNLFSHKFDVYAYFSNVNGLASGAKVHVSGLDAGSVSDIRIPSTSGARFRVTLSVKQKFRPLVRQNSVASISSQGMVGDEFVEIDPGSGEAPECKNNCTIQSSEPLTLSDLLKEGSGVMQTLNSTLHSAGEAAQNADKAISTFDARENGGETGPERLSQAVANAQRATNNVAEDTEALKHNFFLRGFFKHRGFYSLGQMSAEQYRKSNFVKEKKSKRIWLAADKLFTNAHGQEELTEEGKRALDEAMSNFTSLLPNKPLMIEGYSNSGSAADEYRVSEERAEAVRDYLMSRFELKPQYTGTMPLSDSPPEQTGQSSWDGISLVMLT
jgi:outer membrane protein OmpA-like peptidoglycan-associated protein